MSIDVQCPACQQTARVADENAGSTVRCPHCEKTFVVPGQKSGIGDDDDWLKLDDDVPDATEQKADAPAASPDDDPFADLPDTPPPSRTSGATKETPVANSVQYATEYRIRCKVCESPIEVTADQAGDTVQCYDCHSHLVVPPPPKVKKKPKMDVSTAETFSFSEPVASERPADPFVRSARELLDEAEQEDADDPAETYETPDLMAWFADVFGILKDPGVLTYAFGLSLIGGMIGIVIAVFPMIPILMIAMFVATIFLVGMTVACGFTIMEAIANDEDELNDWPELLDPSEWLGPMGVCIAAGLLVSAPAWFLGLSVFGVNLVTVFLIMLMIYLLFPFVLLSMLDMQNVMAPFSPEVARSVTRGKEAWAGFYFSAGVLFAVVYLLLVMLGQSDGAVALVSTFVVAILGTFLYFAMLGRLAYSIGQAINDPPLENDIEPSRGKPTQPSS